jgi:hypothetical protein
MSHSQESSALGVGGETLPRKAGAGCLLRREVTGLLLGDAVESFVVRCFAIGLHVCKTSLKT